MQDSIDSEDNLHKENKYKIGWIKYLKQIKAEYNEKVA